MNKDANTIFSAIGNTPLVELKAIKIPNDVRISPNWKAITREAPLKTVRLII